MSPRGAASRRETARRGGFALLSAALALPWPAAAQPAPAVVLFKAPAPANANDLRSRLAPLGAFDPIAMASVATPIEPERLRELERVEALLLRAREQTAALAEVEALSTLAEAARLAEQEADVPGAAAWNAEVQLGLGVTAMQAGLSDLAFGAFRRAATLDPSRRLLDAEASPAVVKAYADVVRAVALGPAGELEVRASVPGARVFVDDVARGAAPARTRLPVGRHLLRLEAAGHRAYGAFVDVLEGARAPVQVSLAPTPALDAARALQEAAARGDYEALSAHLSTLRASGIVAEQVVVVEAARKSDKLLLVRCDRATCRGPQRVRLDAPWDPGQAPALDSARLSAARDWLAASEQPAERRRDGPSLWTRWYVWGGVAALAAAVTGIVVAAEQQPAQRLRVVVETGRSGP